MNEPTKKPSFFAVIGPGLLVAATGVGAGDLATGALTGSRLGVAILWAVLVGTLMKYVLNEGLARWQLATNSTVLEGTAKHIGRYALIVFLIYLLIWSFAVGAALMSACGVAMHALLPWREASQDKVVYGIMHSLLAVGLVKLGGYRLFGKVMSVSIAAMFVIVIVNTIAIGPDWGEVAVGSVVPRIPQFDGAGLEWTIALMGGVGGTVTVLCYGYWIREEGREGLKELKNCRIDLMTGYIATAVFGLGMVILGSKLQINPAKPAALIVDLADQLKAALGDAGQITSFAFLLGAWGAVFSSMLGVWQSVPYLFADCIRLIMPQRDGEQDKPLASKTTGPIYNWSMVLLATVPIFGLFTKFDQIQLMYALVGAAFMPLLAFVLAILNGSRKRIGNEGRNSVWATVSLVVIILVFALGGFFKIRKTINAWNKPAPVVTAPLEQQEQK